jgi:hypothetical protein
MTAESVVGLSPLSWCRTSAQRSIRRCVDAGKSALFLTPPWPASDEPALQLPGRYRAAPSQGQPSLPPGLGNRSGISHEPATTASVDVSEADWRKCGARGGGADRSRLHEGAVLPVGVTHVRGT